MGVLVTQQMVEDHMSSPVVKDTYDDDNNGVIDPAAMASAIDTSEAIFFGTVRGVYALPLTAPYDPLAIAVVLQLIHCQTIKRFPERFRNGLKVCEDVKGLLTDIRKGNLQLAHALISGSRDPEAFSETSRGYGALEYPTDED